MTPTIWSAGLLAGLFLVPPAVAQQPKENATPAESSPAGKTPDLKRVKELIFQSTNQFRKQEERGTLRLNDPLGRAAQYFAEYLARTDKFSHTADGKEPWDRAARFGYAYSLIAENIAWEYNSAGFTAPQLATALMEGWKKSPGHRKNMLDPDVEEIGVGVARSESTGRYYAVQDFGRPKSKEISFKITNLTDAAVRYRVDDKDYTLLPSYTVTQLRARPPKVAFEPQDKSKEKERLVFHPTNGEHLTVRKGDNGRLVVGKE